MSGRRLAVLLVAVLLCAGCSRGQSGPGDPEPATPTAVPTPTHTRTATSGADPSTTPSPTGAADGLSDAAGCRGTRAVIGPQPDFPPRRLRAFRAQRAVCAAYRLARVDDDFVPQSLAVDGATAYVGGYLHRPRYADQACQIAVVDLHTGAEKAFLPKFQASVYRPQPTFCRHGGGMQLTADGLWVQETQRLWLLDPDRIGRGDPVLRVWRLDPAVRGSTMVVAGDRLGVGSFKGRGPGRLVWYRVADLLRHGVDDLLTHAPRNATDAGPVASRDTPTLTQGITAAAGGLWFSTSGSGCALLHAPSGRRYAWVPGAEDLEFHGADVWVVSESGSRHVVRGSSTTVPQLFRLRTSAVLRLSPDCR